MTVDDGGGGERPLVLVVVGPTGVGKTAAAVHLAARVPIEVIGADSRQVYRGMDVATAKPTRDERQAVRHHLLDIVDPDDRYNAARFCADASAAIAAVRERGRLPVVVGGTGLYVRALLRGLDPAPPADPAFRAELVSVAARSGRAALHARLERDAPDIARRLHPNDSVRIIRALELVRAGASLGEAWRRPAARQDVVYVGLTMDRARLRARLDARAEGMMAGGLAAEVRSLLDRGYDRSLPAMQGIGYRDVAAVLAGEIGEAEALRRMQRDTARYARRQWTWFQREPGIAWIDVEAVGGPAGVAAAVEERLRARDAIA
jgi:tRNA dimethylallyltransferase